MRLASSNRTDVASRGLDRYCQAPSKGLRKRKRPGTSYFQALLTIALLAGIAMAMVETVGMEVRKASNQRDSLVARHAAESGMGFLVNSLKSFQVYGSPSGQTLLAALSTYLSGALPGGSVSYSGSQITVNSAAPDPACGSCVSTFDLDTDGRVRLSVIGRRANAERHAEISFNLVSSKQFLFSKGLVAGGPIRMSGSATLRAANNSSEASVFTISESGVVFDLGSSVEMDGDLYAVPDDPNSIDLSGAVEVGGVRRSNPAIWDHIHLGTSSEDIPRPDPSLFEGFATTTLIGPFPSGQTYTNARIPAGTNPSFGDNTILRGVTYIESPNVVTFTGGATVVGVLVTEDAGTTVLPGNRIVFLGSTNLYGVESLPDDPQFADIKTMTGSSILAPGFSVYFGGSFGAVSGTLAAEKLYFSGSSSATIYGLVLSLGSEPFFMGGSSDITIDRSRYDIIPAGFRIPSTLVAVSSTYTQD